MPYTPPSQQSPASSKSVSPAVSRSSSISELDVPRSPITGRPQLPRSHSSASYMSRQRRSPSATTSNGPPTPTESVTSHVQATDFATRSSVRQSPPPVNDHMMPTGAVISPPDSDNSDDGEGKERGREYEIAELQKAVRSIDLRRDGSPDNSGKHVQMAVSAPVSQITSPSALSPEARKISHSRSSTAEIVVSRPTFAESPTQTTDDSEEDDEGPLSKPSLVRKKSGELVKPALRPSSRRRYSSMPGTPTYHKSVHFNESENQTRHFLQVDKPMAVSAGSSPVETYDSETEYPFDYNGKTTRDIKLSNFPQDTFERKLKPVRVERFFLSADKETLVGTVAVQNLSFQKLVIARFTLDHWKTTSEVVAEYNNDLRHSSDGCDKFNFHIKLSDSANIESKTLLLCVRYNVNGVDYWDNNDNRNYQIDFFQAAKKAKVQPNSSLGARPLSAIPRSRHLPPSSTHGRGRSDSTDDEFGARFDMDNTYQFTPNKIITESGGSIKLKPKPKRVSVNTNGPTQSHNNLGGRYDFGASLSAALSTAQDRLGRNSGLMNGSPQRPSDGYFGLQERNDSIISTKEEKPDFSISNNGSGGDRPAMGSAQYRDLVQKFCYFTSSGTGKGTSTPQNTRDGAKPAAADGTDDEVSVTTSSSGSSSPCTPEDVQPNRKGVTTTANLFSRSASPSPLVAQDYSHRAVSPASFGYPYSNSMRDGYFDSPQLTAIHG